MLIHKKKGILYAEIQKEATKKKLAGPGARAPRTLLLQRKRSDGRALSQGEAAISPEMKVAP